MPEQIFLTDANHQQEQIKRLIKQGLTPIRLPAPKEIELQPNLTQKPAWVRLLFEGRSQNIMINPYPFPPSDQVTLWGISANGNYVALSVSGPDVPR